MPERTDHEYLSTACLHAGHAYCQSSFGKVAACCKFCAAPCTCDCHKSYLCLCHPKSEWRYDEVAWRRIVWGDHAWYVMERHELSADVQADHGELRVKLPAVEPGT